MIHLLTTNDTRVPTFLGSTENVFELDQFYRYYGDDEKDDATSEG